MSRGPLGWAREKAGWSAAVDLLTGLLAWLGVYGSGEAMIRNRDEARERLKGRRKQTLGVILDAYEVSMEKKTTIWKEPALIIAVGGALLEILNLATGMLHLPEHSPGHVALAVAVLVLSAVVTNARLRIEGKKAETETVRHLANVAEKEAAVERTREAVEQRRLEHERRAPLAYNVTVTDGPVSR